MNRTAPEEQGGRTTNDVAAEDLVVDHHTHHGLVRALECGRFDVPGGTTAAVVGPSGSGKSTLLGLLAGLAVPTSGTVRIGDDTISSMTERQRIRFRRRHLGMVYQVDNLLPHLSVEENLGLQLAICRPDRSAGDGIDPGAVLARLGLGALASRLPDQLSGGQRQRVAVARAIVHGPAVILADEPTGALDPANAAGVIDLLVEAHDRTGATLVVVTHDPQVAERMDRTVDLGRLAPSGVRHRAR